MHGDIFVMLLCQSSRVSDWEYDECYQEDGESQRQQCPAWLSNGLTGAPSTEPIAGRWSGDRISLVGDHDNSRLYRNATELYANISEALVEAWNQLPGCRQTYLKYERCGACTDRFYASQNCQSDEG